jgi:hypothetical protein
MGSYGLKIGHGAAFTYVHPHNPVNLSEFRPRIRSLPGLHITVLAANNASEPVGPDAFDSRLVHWLARTSDTLIVNSMDAVGPTAARLEAVLRPSRRALLVVTCFERQDAWLQSIDAHAPYSAGIHALLETGVGSAGSLSPGIIECHRSGPLQ